MKYHLLTAAASLDIIASTIASPLPSDIGTFAWLSDTHLDQLYGTQGAKIHKQGAPCNLTSAPKYSAHGCGGSLALVTAAIAAAANATNELGWPDLDFILFTGDNTRHNSQNKSVVLQNIDTVQSLFIEYFPNTTVVELPALDLGNNDSPSNYYLNITSHEPCLPSSDPASSTSAALPAATNSWLEELAEQQSYMFATELEMATFACGGYLNRALSEKLHVIVLNTIVWSLSHNPNPGGMMDEEKIYDPFGQFEWLETQLSELQNAGKKAYVTGHIPPMLQSFVGSLGEPLYEERSQQRLWDIMAKYQNTVAGIFMAHVHSNELRYNPAFPEEAPPVLISGSIAPCYTTDPTFSIIQYDKEGTSYPVDMATFTVDLKSPDDNNNMKNPFNLTFPSLIDYLEMASLTNKEVLKLSNKMLPGSGETNGVIWDRYFNHWYKGAPQTLSCDTLTCQRSEACLVACGFASDSWNDCNSSATGLTAEVACNFVEDGVGGDNATAQTNPSPQPTKEGTISAAGVMECTTLPLLLMYATFFIIV